MYAILDVNGKQHKVQQGDILEVDLLEEKKGEIIEFDKVLYLSDDKEVIVGTPHIEKAKVIAEVMDDVKGEKIIAFKYGLCLTVS